MGILWIFECLHYLQHEDHEGDHEDSAGANFNCLSFSELLFRAFGVINLARGVLIFYIFVCKDSILSKVTICGRKLPLPSKGRASPVQEISLQR